MNYVGNLIIWVGSYTTNSPLPIYDPSRILQWDDYEIDFIQLQQVLNNLKSKNYHFNNAIIRSNGEFTLSPTGTNIIVKEGLMNNKIFDNIIYHTNGTLFDPTYFYLHEYYKDILCSVDRISFDKIINKEFYQYTINNSVHFYEDFENFTKNPLRINFIYTNKLNAHELLNNIDNMITTYANITHVNIEIPKIYGITINANNLFDNEASKWIIENMCTKEQYEEILTLFDTVTSGDRLVFFNRYEWHYKNVIITCNYPPTNTHIRYGKDLIYYNNKLYNYAKEEIII